MQSAFQFPSQSSLLQLSWQTHKTQSHSTLPNPRINKTSINFSCGYEFKEIGGGEAAPNTVVRLPVVVRRAGKVSRYVWEGGRLRLVCFNREPSDCFGVNDGFRRLYEIWGSAIRELFVPLQVQGNYMVYLKWKLVHRLFSSALHVLATQAMFRAIGIGSAQSLPSAAALNWVLKDGLGRLSRCIYTASLGSAFDTNLKKVRFSTSVLYSMSIGVELLTPVFPQYFLLLATIANIAKSISLAAYLATGSAIHRSFAIADNLGEVSAKAQIQTVCFDNLGLMVAALLNILCNNSERLQAGLPLVVYPIFSAVDLFAIYQGLKHVHLQTLTKDRLEIIVETWIHLGFVPSPAEVSNKEGIGFLRIKGSKMWPIRIGCVDPKDPSSKFSMLTMQSLRGEDFYFLCMETSYRELTRKQQQGILLCLREQAGTADIVMGLLQACYIRKVLLPCRTKWDCILEDDNTADSFLGEWFKVVEDGKTYTQGQIKLLSEEIQKTGWAFKNILLNRREQIRYSLVDD